MRRGIKRVATTSAIATSAWLIVAFLVALTYGQPREPAAVGEQLFVQQGCYGCHMIEKFGTPIGPDLSHFGALHSRDYIARWLTDPSFQRPSHMPKIALSEHEIRALTAYLASLQ